MMYFVYPLINQKMRNKLQVNQNKCIRFSLKLTSRHHIGAKEFKEINWLQTKERVVTINVFKYWTVTSPFYVSELFVPSRNKTIKSNIKLDHIWL